MKLHVATKKEQEIHELANIIHSVETSCVRQRKKAHVEREKIVTFPPLRSSLHKINTEITGWLTGRNSRSKYTTLMEKYENNQCYWLDKWKRGKMDKEGLIQKLTALEKWFACIIEPPPKLPSTITSGYMRDLEAWKQRESTKYTASRSYYCYEDIVPLLDKKELLTVQKQLFENYKRVNEFFQAREKEYEKEKRKRSALEKM